MATKTISITIDAYDRLKSVQKENESFSQVISRVIWQPKAFEQMLKQIEKNPLSESTVEAVEQVIAQRNKPAVSRSRRRRK